MSKPEPQTEATNPGGGNEAPADPGNPVPTPPGTSQGPK